MGTAIGALIPKKGISLDSLNGLRLGFDSYNVIYQFLSSIRGADGTPLMDSEGRVTSHLTGLFYRTANLLERGIQPVFIFDGVPHKLKSATLEARHKVRTEAIAKHEEALKKGELAEARKYGARALKLTDEMVEGAKQLLMHMGLPVVQAPGEGEAQIAGMVERGDLYGCVSQDYDALLFGAERLLRNITVTGKRKVQGKEIYADVSPEIIELNSALRQLGITRRQLIWAAILVGTDFNEKFPKIGPVTALKLAKEHKSFEEIADATGHSPDFDYREIEEIFLHPSFSPGYKIEFKKPDREGVVALLCGKHDFSEERVNSTLGRLEASASEKGSQSRLGNWL